MESTQYQLTAYTSANPDFTYDVTLPSDKVITAELIQTLVQEYFATNNPGCGYDEDFNAKFGDMIDGERRRDLEDDDESEGRYTFMFYAFRDCDDDCDAVTGDEPSECSCDVETQDYLITMHRID